ncbi:hypothetical protein D9M68_706490 [compost metagenome]
MKRTSGRTSAPRLPSLAAIRMRSQTPAMLTVTCLMRGSRARVAASTLFSNSTFSARLITSSGLLESYNRATCGLAKACTRPSCPAREMERAARAAWRRASAVMALL